MLRCREVVELLGTDAIHSAPLGTRLRVRAHVLMCRSCRAYADSLRHLADSARRLATSASTDAQHEDALLLAVRRAAASADGGAGEPPA